MSFCVSNLFYFVFKGWKYQRKIESLGNWFWSLFLSLFSVFLKYFSLWFWFSNTLFSDTWAIISILYIGSCFCEESCLWSIVITKIVIFSLLWLCIYPSSVEVIEFWSCGYPSCVEVIVVWFCALSLLCKGDCCFAFVPIPLV